MFVIPKKNGGVRPAFNLKHLNQYLDAPDFKMKAFKESQVHQYCTLAFGLASGPFVLTKVCKPILEHLRSQGFRISAYLNDWFLITELIRLAHQLQEISALSDPKIGTPRLFCIIKDTRHDSPTFSGQTATEYSQVYQASSLLVQATPTIIQESGRETKFGLESRSTTGLGKSERVTVEVLPQYSDVEWSLVTSINAQSNNVRR
ncbi:hypothetical protein HMPREF1544_12304, partial [Mucor circinelloides 1006PhL]